MQTPKLIAFAGFAGAGKDEAAKPFLARGWRRHNLGDIIKRQLDPLIREHLGFSAFTERRSEKAMIRGTLESWGEDNYSNIAREYFTDILVHISFGPGVVNTRLMRVREAHLWKDNGGLIYLVENPRARGSSEFEKRCMKELITDATLIDGVVHNESDLPAFHANVERYFKATLNPEVALTSQPEDGYSVRLAGSRSDFDGLVATSIPSNSSEGILERSEESGEIASAHGEIASAGGEIASAQAPRIGVAQQHMMPSYPVLTCDACSFRFTSPFTFARTTVHGEPAVACPACGVEMVNTAPLR